MSALVVDSSVAAKWLVAEEHSGSAHRVLDQGNELHAPHFFLLEMHNIICKWIRRGDISRGKGSRMRGAVRELPLEIHASGPLVDPAYAIANRTGRSLYDCLYIALAERLGCRVVTADRRLYDGLADGPFAKHVMWVEDVE